MKMKVRIVLFSATIALAVSVARAGDINMLGNLSVNSNLTAQTMNSGTCTLTHLIEIHKGVV